MIDRTTNVLWAGTRKGLYGSTDGGNTFSAVLHSQDGSDIHCMDVEIAYTTPSSIYASFGQFNTSVIFKSTDSGNNFSRIIVKTGMAELK